MSQPTNKPTSAPVIPREYLVPFLLLATCFALWGLLNNMSDMLVPAFAKIFSMNPKESSVSQFAFYFAYGCLAIPAALLIKKYSYKIGVLVGLGLFSVGVLGYIPGGIFANYSIFVGSIFVFSCGLSILETSCNPYILAMGSEETSVRRLNFAQSFNPIGSLLGAFIGQQLILANLDKSTADERVNMPAEALAEIQHTELFWLCMPYFCAAVVAIAIIVMIGIKKMPEGKDTGHDLNFLGSLAKLASIPRYWCGVIAQFFYVGLQIGVWTFIVKYCQNSVNMDEGQAGWIYTYSILLFIVCRITCTALMKRFNPANMMAVIALLGIACTLGAIYLPGMQGIWCLIGISGCMSLMFPTIYGIALRGLGGEVKLGAAGLIMAILGAAVLTPIMGSSIHNGTISGLQERKDAVIQQFDAELAKKADFAKPEVVTALKAVEYDFAKLRTDVAEGEKTSMQKAAMAVAEVLPAYKEAANWGVRNAYWWAVLCFIVVFGYSFAFRNAHKKGN